MSESSSSSTVTSTASLPMPTTGTAAPRTTRTIHKQDPATEEEKKTETETDTDVRWMGPLPEESASARQHGDYCSGMPGLSGIPTRRRGRKSSTVSNCIVGNTDSVTSHQVITRRPFNELGEKSTSTIQTPHSTSDDDDTKPRPARE